MQGPAVGVGAPPGAAPSPEVGTDRPPGATGAPAATHPVPSRAVAGRKRVLLPVPMLHPDGEALLASGCDVLRAADLGPDGVRDALPTVHGIYQVVRPADLAAAVALEVVGGGGSGVENIDLAACSARGILVVNAAGAQNHSVAEHAIGLLLAVVKRIAVSDRLLRAGRFPDRREYAGDGWPLGIPHELHGKVLGVVGFGAVGRELARACGAAFAMRVVAYDPYADRAAAAALGAELLDDLDAVLATADVVSLHLPLTDETAGLVDAGRLARMAPHAVLLNLARGGVVDEDALVAALRAGAIAGAGLDVFADEPFAPGHPLTTLDNVVLTPHIAGWTAEAMPRLAVTTATGMLAALRGERPERLVNPEAWDAFVARRRT